MTYPPGVAEALAQMNDAVSTTDKALASDLPVPMAKFHRTRRMVYVHCIEILKAEVKCAPTTGAFRPGLPSVEDVRAHEERGGRWVLDHAHGGACMMQMRVDPGGTVAGRLDNWALWEGNLSAYLRSRPVGADGYSLPWPDEVNDG